MPVFKELSSLEDEEDMAADIVEHDSDVNLHRSTTMPQCFNQTELNDLVRDLSLSKELSDMLASRLNEKNLLQYSTKVTFYHSRE